jgi:hypothetical protein
MREHSAMRLPTNLILAVTAVLVIATPVSLILLVGGMSEARFASGIVLAGFGLLLLEKGLLDWFLNTRRVSIVYVAYATGLILCGAARFQSEGSTADAALFVAGALAIILGGLVRARDRRKVVQS